jgi:hypothetical protein
MIIGVMLAFMTFSGFNLNHMKAMVIHGETL